MHQVKYLVGAKERVNEWEDSMQEKKKSPVFSTGRQRKDERQNKV